jgi:hypothetical protein
MNEEARITAVKSVESEPARLPATTGPTVTQLRLAILRKRMSRLHLLETT